VDVILLVARPGSKEGYRSNRISITVKVESSVNHQSQKVKFWCKAPRVPYDVAEWQQIAPWLLLQDDGRESIAAP
jgi:hypothetical protein